MSKKIKISSTTLRCSGPDPNSEHPMVYLTVLQYGVRCPYCNTEYQLSPEVISKRLLD